MSKDYYSILNISRTSTDYEIKQSYRKLALYWHPDSKNHDINNRPIQLQKFRDISEAYFFLSDPSKKAIYDQYGQQGLLLGVPDGKGNYNGGYKYDSNAEEIFTKFFGSYNPFTNVFGEYGSFNSPYPFDPIKNNPAKNPNTIINVKCTLAELYTGITKHINVTRNRFDVLKNLLPNEKSFEVVITPGFKNGTKITFPLDGDESNDASTGDLQFVIEELPHELYLRSKNDLILTSKIHLRDALCAVSVQVDALDGRKFTVPIDEIVTPTYKKIIENEGMPDSKSKIKGNLILAFEIIFPKSLSTDAKKQLHALLK